MQFTTVNSTLQFFIVEIVNSMNQLKTFHMFLTHQQENRKKIINKHIFEAALVE